MNVTALKPEEVPEHLETLWPYLENFADRSHGRLTVEDAARSLAEGRLQAWVCWDDVVYSVALTRITGSAVEIIACAGAEAEKWRDALLDEIEAWAGGIGALHVVPSVRPGWFKWLRSRGYGEAHREMVKGL